MRSLVAIFVFAAVVALVQGYARTEELSGTTHQGVVERVFVEQDLGVYVDRASAPRIGTAWVDVRFPEPLADGSTTAIALLPTNLRAEAGDHVEMRFAGKSSQHNGDATLDENRVVALLHRHASVPPIPASKVVSP